MTTVAILGATGMLGSMLLDVFSRDKEIKLMATVRDEKLAKKGMAQLKSIEWRALNAEEDILPKITSAIAGAHWVINAIGVIKPHIRTSAQDVERAIRVNSLFPHLLAQAAENSGGRILQIATDCVYSGNIGNRAENSPHDALDVYGKTKSLGECASPAMHHLRCSIIGPEPKTYASLLEWFRRQPKKAPVKGYTNHLWNGITTLHFASLCRGIIKNNLELPRLQHVIPKDVVSKHELLKIFAREFQREDILIEPYETNPAVDRTLATENEAMNQRLWSCAGYVAIPTIQKMVAEVAQYEYNVGKVWL